MISNAAFDFEIDKKRRVIENLKKDLALKKHVFDLIKRGEKKEAKKILDKDGLLLSYFMKFKGPPVQSANSWEPPKVILGSWNDWVFTYEPSSEDEITEDLSALESRIEEKENKLEEYIFLKQQQNFMRLQEKDIENNQKDRSATQEFTFIVAFGVVIGSVFNLYQILNDFLKSPSLHLLILSGIFTFFFVIIINFIFFNFNMKEQGRRFLNETKMSSAILFLLIVLLTISLFIFPNVGISLEKRNTLDFSPAPTLNTTSEKKSLENSSSINFVGQDNLSGTKRITNKTSVTNTSLADFINRYIMG